MFKKLELETIRQSAGNAENGKAEVISAISRMKNKQEVFGFLSKNNKKFNEMGMKFSAQGGEIKINGIVLDLTAISSISQKDPYSYFSEFRKNSTEPTTSDRGHFNMNIEMDVVVRFLGIIIGPISLREKLYLILTRIFDYFNIYQGHFKLIEILNEIFPIGRRHIGLMKMILSFVQKKVEQIQQKIDMNQLDQFDSWLMKYFKDLNDCQRKLALVQIVCDNLLLALQYNSSDMDDLLKFSIDWIMNAYVEYIERRERTVTIEQGNRKEKYIQCKVCQGIYYTT